MSLCVRLLVLSIISVAAFGPSSAMAQECNPACAVGQDCVNGQCVEAAPTTTSPAPAACNPPCGPQQACVQGTCRASQAPPGQAPVVQQAPVQSPPPGQVAQTPPGQQAPAAQCVPQCRMGYICQAGTCVVDPATGCNPPCPTGALCSGGQCYTAQQPAVGTQGAAPPVNQPPARGTIPTEYLPVRRTLRPLALPRGTLAPFANLGFTFFRSSSDFEGDSTDVNAGLSAGAAFGIIDALEVGLTLLSFGLAPEFNARDPYLYLRSAFLRTRKFQMGVSYGLNIPVTGPNYVSNNLALEMLIRSSVFRFLFEVGSTLSAPIDEDANFFATPFINMLFGFQFADIVGMELAFNHSFFDAEADNYRLTIRPGLVFTIPRGEGQSPLMDIAARVGLVSLVSVSRTDEVSTDTISFTINATFYLDLF